ncbi:hypothetical protein [Salinisphaera sp. LB1]|uniref:hypothetical protein n=1 Tax=Salinisphaera sp. LB1 TaxID=2183911 RepID=UPI0011AB78C0|nr:hypothetical protein [Salinisphaera sp. LB1]
MLAKIMLAERFAPELYDAMARGSANTGASEELAALEAAVAAPPPDQEAKSEKGKEKALPAEVSLPDWPNLEMGEAVGRYRSAARRERSQAIRLRNPGPAKRVRRSHFPGRIG